MFTVITGLGLVTVIGLGMYLAETQMGMKVLDKINLF